MSHATPTIIAFHRPPYTESNTSPSGTSTHEDYVDLSQESDTRNKSGNVRSLSRAYAPRNGHEGGSANTPLTSRVLSKHNLQQAYMSRILGSQHASQYGHVTMLEAAVVPADGFMHGLHNEGTGSFNDDLPDPPYQTQSRQHSTASMYNEADHDTPNYQSGSHWQAGSVYQDNAIDMPGTDMSNVDPLSWDIDQGRELTAWDNALAGVGEHLADHMYQEYTSHDELVVE